MKSPFPRALNPAAPTRPGFAWLRREDSGVAILLVTMMLSMVSLALAAGHFMQNRTHRFELMRQRAEIYARYCSEYAVACYGVPNFMQHSELADAVDVENNWLEPRSMQEIYTNLFQADDDAHRFSFSYDNLKMDKVFDLGSSKPFYFVSAQGLVSWRDGNGRIHEADHRSAVALAFIDFSDFLYFTNREIAPDNSPVTFGSGDRLHGRVHTNGRAQISSSGMPVFSGRLYSQVDPTVGNLNEEEFPNVFRGGWSVPHPRIQWPPLQAIDRIKERRLAEHTYDDVVNISGVDHPLTTYLVFDRTVYHVAQYLADSLGPGQDTVYVSTTGTDWNTKPLPGALGSELIYVEGVCRLKGIVRGRITVLASDSMFIMDNIITEDTVLGPCVPPGMPAEGNTFGMVPFGSHNRIGLASEKDIIIAATLQNGWANGAMTPGGTCGTAYDPAVDSNVGNVCQQGRRDVIITAALFAAGCSIESEYWRTSAFGAGVPNPMPQSTGCEGMANTHATVGGCPGASQFDDRRGTVHLCGSMVQTNRGFVIRNPPSPWGQAWIGYQYKNYRYDENFLSGGPPVWFGVYYADGSREVSTKMLVPDYDRWRASRREFLNLPITQAKQGS